MTRGSTVAAFAIAPSIIPFSPAEAAVELPGAEMGWPWALPFVAVLLSIALGPLLFARIWHHHYGKIVGAWAVVAVVALAAVYGAEAALAAVVHAALGEYLSFIVLLFTMIIYVSVFDVRRIARDVRTDAPAKSVPANK